MSLIQHQFFPRSMFDMDFWGRPDSLGIGPSTLDLFDPFDQLDHQLSRNLLWIDRPDFMTQLITPILPRVPHKYRITVDCTGYNPKLIKTNFSDDKTKLIVSAKDGESKTSDDGDYSIKEFRRTYELPKNVETDKMVSFVTAEGCLVIEMPIKEEEKKQSHKRKSGESWDILSGANLVTEENGKKVVKMNLDVPQNVDPSKIKVTCKDRDLIVQAEDKVEKDDGVSQFYFYRRSTLPENTDLNALKCSLDADKNKLMIEAPYNDDLKPKGPRVIPIQMNGAEKKSIENKQVESNKK
jgi:HSP20 family molecular chaperone IbpA